MRWRTSPGAAPQKPSLREDRSEKRRGGYLVLDEDVLRFLRTAVGSLWALEQLLLLQREPERKWTVDGMVRELRSSKAIVSRSLTQFSRAGLVQEINGEFVYRPRTPEIADLVTRVASGYAMYPVAVTRALLVASDHEIQSFADAFRVDKPEKEE
jgi:hypothetical protein